MLGLLEDLEWGISEEVQTCHAALVDYQLLKTVQMVCPKIWKHVRRVAGPLQSCRHPRNTLWSENDKAWRHFHCQTVS
jgi:hypothetical protein